MHSPIFTDRFSRMTSIASPRDAWQGTRPDLRENEYEIKCKHNKPLTSGHSVHFPSYAEEKLSNWFVWGGTENIKKRLLLRWYSISNWIYKTKYGPYGHFGYWTIISEKTKGDIYKLYKLPFQSIVFKQFRCSQNATNQPKLTIELTRMSNKRSCLKAGPLW